jgi:hypothetical protein
MTTRIVVQLPRSPPVHERNRGCHVRRPM